MTSVAEALRDGVALLTAAGIDDAPRDARRLMAHALAVSPDRLTLHAADTLVPEAAARWSDALAARAVRQPVAQIVGRRSFWGHEFRVTRDTLDPRPETELLVAEALSKPFVRMLDLGTGTGCILLSCLADMKAATGIGTDVSPAALAVAEGNAAALGLGGRARFRLSDWFAGVPDRFDLIVSNPPYITEGEMAGLAPEVRDWEPVTALTPGGDGLAAYRAIAQGAPARLLSGGRLLVEIGWTQAAPVSALLSHAGFADIRVLQDIDGRDRAITARKP